MIEGRRERRRQRRAAMLAEKGRTRNRAADALDLLARAGEHWALSYTLPAGFAYFERVEAVRLEYRAFRLNATIRNVWC